MPTTYFTADLHLDHEKVLKMSNRQFGSIGEHDEHVIGKINEYVRKDDRLFVLGDVSWHSIGNYIERIECRDIHLIWGNHDRANFGKHFKTAEDTALINIGEHKFFLSHYPHAYWAASHRGSFHLYGHMHRQRETVLDKLFPGRRSMDVGIDNAKYLLGEYRPFSVDEILSILGDRTGHDPVSFYTEFQAQAKDDLCTKETSKEDEQPH